MKVTMDIPEEVLIQALLTKVPKTRQESMAVAYGEAITKKQACALLNVSSTTLWRLIQEHKVKTAVGGTRIDTRSLAYYLERGG